MKYIRGTSNLPLILSSNGRGVYKLFIYGFFAVHPNMRGHTCGSLSVGRGFIIVSFTKQKLNTQISIENEVVGVDYCIPAVLWNRYWFDAYGYDFFKKNSFKTIKELLFWRIVASLQSVSTKST